MGNIFFFTFVSERELFQDSVNDQVSANDRNTACSKTFSVFSETAP